MLAWRFAGGITPLAAEARSCSTVSGGVLHTLSAHELIRGMNSAFPSGTVQFRVKLPLPRKLPARNQT